MTAILAFLGAIFPTVAGWINLVIGYFQKKTADQNAANSAEQDAETQHQNDGKQSVDDKTSADAQNSALDQLEKQLDNPVPIEVTKPGGTP